MAAVLNWFDSKSGSVVDPSTGSGDILLTKKQTDLMLHKSFHLLMFYIEFFLSCSLLMRKALFQHLTARGVQVTLMLLYNTPVEKKYKTKIT